MAFDVQGALRAGYTPAEVADYLASQSSFDINGAREAGYSDEDILGHLSKLEPKGFFSNVGTLLKEGAEQALTSAEVSPAVISGSGVEQKAGLIAGQLSKPQTGQPAELKEAKGAFKDEGEAWEKAQGFWQGAGAIGDMLVEVGRQAITNPKGLAYLTAEQAANMAPSILGMLMGGRAGAVAGSVAGPKGAAIGTVVGAVGGAFTGQAPLEVGSEFIGLVGKELAARNLEPTEANVVSLLQDKDFTERAVSDARVKGATTAGIDAALTVASGGVATGPRRIALKAATEELGAGADAAQIAKRASEILDQRTIGQKIGTGAAAVGVDVAGGGLSEAGGQLAAYGKVDLADVGLEMLGELGGAGIEVPAAAYTMSRDELSKRRQLAEEKLKAATNVSDAASAADELAGSLDELTGSIDAYLGAGGTKLAPSAPGQQALQLSAQQRADREAELLAQAQQAGTDFDRRMAMDQINVLRGEPKQGASTGFVDLTPMDELQVQQRLAVLRDETARAGGNALGLTAVPHPSQPGRFAIAQQELPSLNLETTSTPISTQEAQARIESAALAGQERARKAEDSPRQQIISRAMAAIEARGGVASPMEAEILRQANMGQPYDRIDPTLSQSTTPAQTTPWETIRPAAVAQANAEGLGEQAARAQANQAQAQTQLTQQIEQTSQPAPLPNASDVIAALATPGAQRTAEQTSLIRQGESRYDPVDFSILQRAATAPFQLNADERVRLKDLRSPPTNVPETGTNVPESGTTVPESGLIGTRVTERLGTPAPGRIITSGAKLSTTRGVAPGATLSVQDGNTSHDARVVDIGRLGNTGRLINQIGRIFGKRVVAFESDTLQADGFVLDNDNQNIYINTKSQMSPLAVFGHEMTHLLKRDNAEAYTALQTVVQRQLGEGAMERFTQEYGEGANIEELTSDLVGNRFQEADFWQGVFDEISAQNPEGARGIIIRTAAAITKAINAFMRLVRQPSFQADQYVKDANEIKKAVRTALATYAQTQKASAMQMEAELAKAESGVDLAAGARAEPVASAADETAAPAAPERAPLEQRQREAARAARQQMGETITASPSRVGYNVSETNLGEQDARVTDTARDGGVSTTAEQDRPEPGEDGRDQIPSYGQAREGAIAVVARHYSQAERQSLDSNFYGRGLRGGEARRLDQSTDPRLRQRIYFYVDQGQGITPEGGVGSIAHEVRLENIYDPASGLIPPQENANAFESAVINAGFDGYIAPFGKQAAVVLLGPKHTGVSVRPIKQASSQLSRTRNVPESIDSFARLEQIFQRARAESFNTNRELKVSIQQALLAAAREARIDLSARTPEVEQYLVRVGVADALYAIRSNANAVGWYDKTVTKALKILGKLHPEINTDPNAKFAFTWALAVTSNGQKVDKNFELAEAAYKAYKRTGRMPTNIQAGQAQKAINESLGLFNAMVDQYGIDNVRRFMDTKFVVSQIERATGLSVGGEFKDTEVRGAAVLGPKIGNGFFSNLNGFFDQLTMDRWLMRTWGRWTGSLIERRPDMVRAKREELVTLVAEMKKNAPAAAEFQAALGRKLTVGNPDALALAIQKASMLPATREKFNKTPVGESLRKTGNALAKYLDGQKEAPAGPEERNFIRRVFSQILDQVREKGFPSLTMSDLQALLWYPEKRLYDIAKSDESAQEGYEDDEAPDYANAAAKLAKANGVSEQDIKSAINEAENEYETRERAGSTQRDAGDRQAQARSESGARGFTERGKRQFLTTGVIHRIRSDRSGDAEQSGPYSRKSGGSGAGLRVLGQPSVAVYSPATKFFELAAQGAQLFQDAIQSSKNASPFGAAVFVYPEQDYQGMRLFLTEDAKAGFALNGDDIVSVFAGPEQRGAVNAIMQLAIQEGGRRLDAFNTVLPELYSVHGFKIVARSPWNNEFAPEGWNKATFKEFNGGEPDVVFMVYDANYFGAPQNSDGTVIENYDDGPAAQRKALGGETQFEVVSADASAADENVQFSRQRTSPFYSQLAKAIDEVPARLETQPAAQWKAWLASNASKLGIKKEEIEWTGINEYLDLRGKDKVTKAEIGEYLNANGVQVKEVQLQDFTGKYIVYEDGVPVPGEIFDTEAQADKWIEDQIEANLEGDYSNEAEVDEQQSRYESGLIDEADVEAEDGGAQYKTYQLPGGKNYKELLLTLPPKTEAVMEYQVIGAFPASGFKSEAEAQEYIDNFEKMLDTLPQETAQSMRETLKRNPFSIDSFETKTSRSEKFKSRHWKPENVLAHIRFNERTDADGNRVLFIEEMQSDWAQEGRKRGFAKNEIKWLVKKPGDKIESSHDTKEQAEDAMRRLARAYGEDPQTLGLTVVKGVDSRPVSGVPSAPFVGDTKTWLALATKRMIAYAVDNGFDKVAFINGEQSADRYNLAKVVDYIEYEQTDPGKYYIRVTDRQGGRPLTEYQQTAADLEDKIGKELTQQILAGEGEKGDDGNTLLRAKDFKIGGEGMVKFYDQIVPQVVNDVLKKVGGGKLEPMSIGGMTEESWGVSSNRDGTLWTAYVGIREVGEYKTKAEASAAAQKAYNEIQSQQLGFTITDAMKAKVEEGLPLFSPRRRNYGNLTADQEQALRNVGGIKPDQTTRERMEQLAAKFSDTWVGGVFDQFAELRKLDPKAYVLARLSKGTDGTLEALMLYGKPFLTKDGVADVDIKDEGFAKVLGRLEGEQDRFLWWVAAQRAERLKAQGLENLFTDQDITSLKTFNQGNLPSGKPRAQAYAQALQEMNDFNDAVLEVAEKSGLIDPEARRLFKDTPYVPFYRVMEQEDGVAGPTFSSGLVNQYAWKKLKGGKQKLNDDLLANMLLNWSHLYAAAAKNRAAKASLEAGVQAGVAEVVPSGTKGSVRVRENGKEVNYLVTDPGVMAAIGAIEYRTPGFFKPFSTMKRWLSIGVTANPTYKVKNLMRDSLSSIAVSDLSANPLKNIGQGFKKTSKENQTFASMLAGGGLIRFGSMLDGDNAARTRKLIEKEGGQLLDEKGWKKLGRMVVDTWDAYNELGDRFENANRAALYEQLRAKGYSELDANFMSRDLMDFSMSGRWPVVRFLVETVPFMNARLQGLYKLGRGAKENPKKFGYTVGAVALASLALMLAYEDDEDWKKRPDWDRDANWWFKIGDVAFRIPKPFEVGAIGTIAERGWELAFNKEMTMRRFGQRMSNMIFDTFAMDPTPQIIKPLFDVYANKAGFSNTPIEGLGMQRLRPEDRADERTSYAARFLGQLGLPNPAGLARGEYDKLSPVQIDYLLKGYFGWLGTAATTVMDFGIRPMMNAGEKPDLRLRDVFFAGNFVETLPSGSSRYVDQLYEQNRLIEEAYNSYRAALKRGDTAGARKIKEEEGDKLRAYRRVSNISDRVSELGAKIRKIEASKSLSGESKRRMIDQLRQQQDRIAKRAAVELD